MNITKIHFLELKKGEDVRSTIINFANDKNIKRAQINAIGMLENVRLGFWNFETERHIFKNFEPPHELTAFSGNITPQDNTLMLHAHVTLSDAQHQTFGGHFGEGTVAVVMQCFITEVVS